MSRGATVPVYSSRRSDRVVFPWSTCAITEIARVSFVGVDIRPSLSGTKKGPARLSRPFGPVGYLFGRSFWNPFGRVVRSLRDGTAFTCLRVGLRRIAHRFAAADLFALLGRIVDHRSPPVRVLA